MPENFIEVPIETNAGTMADEAIDKLAATWDGWEPQEGDLEVILIEALAQMASDAANVAAVMPAAAFEAILEGLFGVVPQGGEQATGTVTFTLIDTTQVMIPAGTEIDVDGWAFTVDDDTLSTGSLTTVANVPVTATEVGTQANGLQGETVVMVGVLTFVASVSLDAPTSGGMDPETEIEYLDRGAKALELQAMTLVTVHDYELMSLTDARVARAVAVQDMANRKITVVPSHADGTALDANAKADLAALFDHYRQTTWQVLLADPTRTTINVTFQVHVYPDFDTALVVDEAEDEVKRFLDPELWGSMVLSDATTPGVEPRVRKNKLIDVIANAVGVNYVIDLTITGSAGSVQPNGDWLLPGTVPVPVAGTITGTPG